MTDIFIRPGVVDAIDKHGRPTPEPEQWPPADCYTFTLPKDMREQRQPPGAGLVWATLFGLAVALVGWLVLL